MTVNDDRKVWSEPELKQQATSATEFSTDPGTDLYNGATTAPSFAN